MTPNTIFIMGGPGGMAARYSSRNGDDVEVLPHANEAEGDFCERATAMAEAAGASLVIFGPPKRRLADA